MSAPGATGPPPRRTRALLVLLLLAAAALRWVYADYELGPGRFFDERFSFANVEALLDTGGLFPSNGYYPLLSYLPQAGLVAASDAVHRATGDPRFAVRRDGSFTALAYRLSRGVQVAWGVAGLWLTFLVGRRLFGEATGLAALLVLAFSPWHVHASGYFKPDVMLVTATLAAFLWSLRTIERPTVGRHLLAGAGVALATSSKLTGWLAALPLLFIALVRARREPRRLLGLGAAGVAAVALFFLANPHWRTYLASMRNVQAHYDHMAATAGVSRDEAPLLLGRLLLESFGPVACGLALAGLAVLTARLARRGLGDDRRLAVATLLFFPTAFTAGYYALTSWFKLNNLLPILPYVALLAGWTLVAAARRAAPRLPAAMARPAVAGLLLALFVVPHGVSYVYRIRVPTNEDLAKQFLRAKMRRSDGFVAVVEEIERAWPSWSQHRALVESHDAAALTVERLVELPIERLARVDGLLFAHRRLSGDDATAYLALAGLAAPGGLAVHRSRLFRSRGPGVVAVDRRWVPRGPPRRLDVEPADAGPFRLKAAMPPDVAAGELVSFRLWTPSRPPPGGPPPRLSFGIDEVELLPAGGGGGGAFYVSERLLNRRPQRVVRIDREAVEGGERVELLLYRWRGPTIRRAAGRRPAAARPATPPAAGEPAPPAGR